MPLTDKKRRYAEARLAGETKKAAAIAAGCPEKTASQAASRYEKDADVIAHMGRLKGGKRVEPAEKPDSAPQQANEVPEPPKSAESDAGVPLSITTPRKYGDPLEFLDAVMHDISEDPKLRVDAAKAIAAYKHAKPGAGGKKGEKQAAAKQAARGKFGSQPPPLKAVK